MRWVYLSPHFDDVAFSCGGLAWEQVQEGHAVEIWTICAGEPGPGEPLSPFGRELHERWKAGGETIAVRREEDQAASRRLGATVRFWDLPDCIYRRLPSGGWLVNERDDLWQTVHPQEAPLVARLAGWLAQNLQPDDQLVSPLTVGNHVDHFLVRAAAESLGRVIWFYPDYPYINEPGEHLEGKIGKGWQQICRPVSRAGLSAWQDSVACYRTQISTFWSGLDEMRAALEEYWRSEGGSCLWVSGEGGDR